MTGRRRDLFGIFGAGGCGRGVLPVAQTMLENERDPESFELVFIDDDTNERIINGRRVLSLEEFAAEEATAHAVAFAVSDGRVRSELVARCEDMRLPVFAVEATNVVTMDAVQIGEGAILSPFVTLTSNIKIGRHFHANLYSYVEHDCVVGDFVTFAPAARCNGNVIIEDFAYLGAGCVVKQGCREEPLVIGAGAVIGMGAVVTRSVPPNTTVVGNPARKMESKANGC